LPQKLTSTEIRNYFHNHIQFLTPNFYDGIVNLICIFCGFRSLILSLQILFPFWGLTGNFVSKLLAPEIYRSLLEKQLKMVLIITVTESLKRYVIGTREFQRTLQKIWNQRP